jgi:hypothetical protein
MNGPWGPRTERLNRRVGSSQTKAADVSARRPKLATTFDAEVASDSTHEMIALWEDNFDVRRRDPQAVARRLAEQSR